MIRAIFAATLTAVLISSGAVSAQAVVVGPGCPTGAPYRIDDPLDGDDVTVCGYTPDGWWIIYNDSDTIWGLTSPEPRDFTYRQDNGNVGQAQRAQLFHASAKSWYPYLFLAPGENVIIPADASGVQFAIQPDLALAWIMFDQLADEVEAKTGELIGDVVAGKSARRAALWKCSAAMYKAARKVDNSASWQDDPEKIWESAQSSVADGKECAKAWKKARNAKAEVPFPKYRAVVTKVTQDAQITAEAVERLTGTKAALQKLGSLICSLPKIRGVGC